MFNSNNGMDSYLADLWQVIYSEMPCCTNYFQQLALEFENVLSVENLNISTINSLGILMGTDT